MKKKMNLKPLKIKNLKVFFIFLCLLSSIYIFYVNFSLVRKSGIIKCSFDKKFIIFKKSFIDVDNNSQLEMVADYGNGTKISPFVIENKTINGNNGFCIRIRNTNKYFILRNCTLYNGTYGLYLSNVTNAIIYNNTIRNNTGLFSNSGLYGFQLTHSEIYANNFFSNKYGINIISNSNNNNFSNNFISNNFRSGIKVESSIKNNFFNNTIKLNDYYGIEIVQSNYSVIFNSTINLNNKSGINIILYSFYNQILNSTINNNTEYGVHLNLAYNNTISNNWIINNYRGIYEEASEYNIYHNNKINDLDSDHDNLSDYEEIEIYFTDPSDPDTDNDNLLDGEEIFYQTNPCNNDTDNDNLSDGDEIHIYHSDPLKLDTDFDGLNDWDEIYIYNTLPNNSDSDSDRMPDGWEVLNGLAPTNKLDALQDIDNDGLTNYLEYIYKTNVNNSDTDGDGYSDGLEVSIGTNPLDPNSFPQISDQLIIYIIIFMIIGLIILIINLTISINYYRKAIYHKKKSKNTKLKHRKGKII